MPSPLPLPHQRSLRSAKDGSPITKTKWKAIGSAVAGGLMAGLVFAGNYAVNCHEYKARVNEVKAEAAALDPGLSVLLGPWGAPGNGVPVAEVGKGEGRWAGGSSMGIGGRRLVNKMKR